MGAPPVTAQLLAVGELSPGRSTLLLRVPELIATLRPGHALHLVHAEAGGYRLRRVAPVTKIDLLAGSIEVALLPRADGGRDSLLELRAGAQIAVVGPIGQPIEIDSASQQILIVTDGEGFAWVRLLAASLISAGRSVVLLVEARTAAELPAASLLPEQVEIVVATEDGSLGHQGSAADLMPTYADWADQVIASGERGLLNAVTSAARATRAIDRTTAKGRRSTRRAGAAPWLQLLISHEIGCGSGVCGGCTFSSANGSVRLCREGPAVSAPGLSAGTMRDS
jgi:dihydroorotate dehydrogenase electron transfer subunit